MLSGVLGTRLAGVEPRASRRRRGDRGAWRVARLVERRRGAGKRARGGERSRRAGHPFRGDDRHDLRPRQRGRVSAKGMPALPQLALLGREFDDVIRFTSPPRAVQKPLFAVLGLLGRMRGLKGMYPAYLHPHGRTTPDAEAVRRAEIAVPIEAPDVPAAPAARSRNRRVPCQETQARSCTRTTKPPGPTRSGLSTRSAYSLTRSRVARRPWSSLRAIRTHRSWMCFRSSASTRSTPPRGGSYLYDSAGQGYLDFHTGEGFASLGHNHARRARGAQRDARGGPCRWRAAALLDACGDARRGAVAAAAPRVGRRLLREHRR